MDSIEDTIAILIERSRPVATIVSNMSPFRDIIVQTCSNLWYHKHLALCLLTRRLTLLYTDWFRLGTESRRSSYAKSVMLRFKKKFDRIMLKHGHKNISISIMLSSIQASKSSNIIAVLLWQNFTDAPVNRRYHKPYDLQYGQGT